MCRSRNGAKLLPLSVLAACYSAPYVLRRCGHGEFPFPTPSRYRTRSQDSAVLACRDHRRPGGSVEPGKLADLVVVEENPLQNLKVLYGTGAIKVNEQNQPVRVGGVKYTIKDGIIFDAKQLLEDVKGIVRDAKEKETGKMVQPGMTGL